jgi:hypothetical protein
MATRWIAGLLSVFVALGVAGVGFAAFTDPIVINGSASTGTLDIQIVYYTDLINFPGHTHIDTVADDQFTMTAWNLAPGDYPYEKVKVENVGTLMAAVSVNLVGTGLIAVGGTDGIDVYTHSGLSAVGGVFTHSWVTLAPGQHSWDWIYVGMPATSTTQGLSATFTITYTATVA